MKTYRWLLSVKWVDGTETRETYADPALAARAVLSVMSMSGTDVEHEATVKRVAVVEIVSLVRKAK